MGVTKTNWERLISYNTFLTFLGVKKLKYTFNVNDNEEIKEVRVKLNLITDNHQWTQWRAYWQEDWKWVQTSNHTSEWLDLGWWKFSKIHYNAKMNLTANLKPSDSVKTAIKKGNNYEMKSGYGVQMELEAQKFYNSQDYYVTSAGNAMTFFQSLGLKSIIEF